MDTGERQWVRQVLVAGLALGMLVLVGLVFAYALQLLLMVLAGVLFAIALIQATNFVSRWTKLPYRYAYAVVLLLTVALTGTVVFLVGDSIFQNGKQFAEQFTSSSNDALGEVRKHTWGQWLLQTFESDEPDAEAPPPEPAEAPDEARADETQTGEPPPDEGSQDQAAPPPIVRKAVQSQGLMSTLSAIFTVTGTSIAAAVIVIFLAVYFALDPDLYLHGMAKLLPIDRRERFLDVLHMMGKTLWWWLLGRLVGMAIIGSLSTLGLWIIGIPMALPLGVMAGLLNFVPNVGPTLALVFPLLFALQQGPITAVYVFCWYLGLQFVETYIISPLIEQRQVSLPPGVTIPVQVLFGLTAGLFGLLMATPAAAVVMVLVREYYVKDWLGDRACDDPHALSSAATREKPSPQRAKTGKADAST